MAVADCADVKPVTYTGKVVGTQAFWSPRMAESRRYEGASDDVWALGISLLGMMTQWPKVGTKEDLKKYPKMCYAHAQRLKELNEDDGIVRVLDRMLTWEAKERASAAECVELVTRTLADETRKAAENGDDGNRGVGIKTPEDFRPISFW